MPGGTFTIPLAFVASGVQVADGAITTGTRLLSSASAAFTALMEGQTIVIEGAGAAGADLTTKIVRRISATQVEIADAASTTVTGSDLTYAIGRYQLRRLMKAGDTGGNTYDLLSARRIQLQVNSLSPGKIYVGGPNVTPTNAGTELSAPGSVDNDPGGNTFSDYVTADAADSLLNITWDPNY